MIRVTAAIVAGSALALGATRLDAEAPTFAENTAAAIAEFRAALALTPDLKHGAQLFETCSACHGADGAGARDGTVPAIAGQHVSVLVKQLVDFRHDRRWDERMQNFASRHSLEGAQDLLDVASYAESLPRWPPLEGGTGDGKACNAEPMPISSSARVVTDRWERVSCAACGPGLQDSITST